MRDRIQLVQNQIREIPDFPQKGILFYDITPILSHPRALSTANDLLAEPYGSSGVSKVVGMESRGFIFGVPVAERLSAGFVPVRKPGKLPAQTIREEYQLEYGMDCLEMHRDALSADDKVLIVDDLLATGGTAEATVRLVRSTGAHIVGVAFVIELAFLSGKSKLPDLDVTSLIVY